MQERFNTGGAHMRCKHILFVGLYDNNFTILLKLLYKQQSRLHIVVSAGTDWYAHTELPPSNSVEKIALDLGFVITSRKPLHPKLQEEAHAMAREVFYHSPQSISKIRDFSTFNAIVTPYRKVHDQLARWHTIPEQKLHRIDGIKPSDSPAHALPVLQEWVDHHHF